MEGWKCRACGRKGHNSAYYIERMKDLKIESLLSSKNFEKYSTLVIAYTAACKNSRKVCKNKIYGSKIIFKRNSG